MEQTEIIAQLQAQKETIAQQSKKIDSLTKLIAKGVAAPAETKIPKALTTPKELVKQDGKNYRWNLPAFYLPGNPDRITAEQAATDPEIIAQLLSIKGQGILTEQV